MELDTQARKHIIRTIFEEGWNQERFDSFAPYIDEAVRFNFRGGQHITHLEALKGLIAYWKKAFPDFQFQILAVIAEADLAAANLVFTGTHEGTWQDVEPSGNKIRVEEMMFFRFEGGKVVEMWEVYDEALMNQQMTQGAAD